jgi:hypothetical protein
MPKRNTFSEQLLTPPAPARPSVDSWALCQVCGQERRLDQGGLVVPHRAWTLRRAMMPCAGGGEAPAALA